jgi:nitrogen-specific signal transduction histidine kinase/HD-like signal output (HDOD) protein
MISYSKDKLLRPDISGNTAGAVSHLLSGSRNLPTLPEINLKLIRACNSGQQNISEIAQLIRMDPSLCLKVIDTYYSWQRYPKKLSNMSDAVGVIGTDVLSILVSCSSAVSIFDAIAKGRGLDLKSFWRHSLKCAFLCEAISKDVPGQLPDEAYLSGLFHDMGKMVLLNSLPNIYNKLLSDKEQGSIVLKEKKTIGIDHAYISFRLVDRWQFHPFMADALLYHHYPLEKVVLALPSVKILYLANMLASQETDQRDTQTAARELFGFSSNKLDEYLLFSETKLSNAAAVFEISDVSSVQLRTPGNADNDAPLNLANEIRDTSLIAYTMQNILKAKDEESVLEILKQGYQILFGSPNIYFFIYYRNENTLVGRCPRDDEFSGALNGLQIPANSNGSMLSACLRNKTPIDSFSFQKNSDLPVMDYQLIHFIGKEGMLCVPMMEGDEQVGLILLGVDRAEHSLLIRHVNLLTLFARQCALAIKGVRSRITEVRTTKAAGSEPEAVLSRKVVHEINNPLGVIKNYLKVLGMKLEERNIDHDEIRIINDEINRISKMLKNLSKTSERVPRTIGASVNINTLIGDILKLTKASLGEDSEIKINLINDPSIPEINAEKDDLKQVFLNLIKNAVEAMPFGGNIEIKTSLINGNKSDTGGVSTGITDGRIQITVTDDGPGISDEVGSSLFNEFVTSKQGHEGLGLSIVKGIINNLNGSINCESINNKGTSFIINLPLKFQAEH